MKELKSPLEKFNLRIEPSAFTINDYRVLLGTLHDGFTWHEGDKSQYICPDLRKKDTIVDVLFWEYMWYEPKYKPLIEEALQIVERDIYETKQVHSDEALGLSAEAKAALLIIADETDKLAEYIENVGPSQSTMDKIDRLRKRIVEDSERYGWAYVPGKDRNLIATVLHDLLHTIFKQILPYYQGMRKTPKPLENAKKLKYIAGQLRRLAGEQSGAKTGLSGGDAQGFKFDRDKQAMYNGRDLDISSGRAVKILKLLYDSMPNMVTHEQVNEAAEQPKSRTSEEMTRAYIVSIRKALKRNKIPYTVPPAKRGGGYCLKAVYIQRIVNTARPNNKNSVIL